MAKLKKIRADEASYSQQIHPAQANLPFLTLVRPNICLNKDGSLLAVFQFTGPDADSTSQEQQEVNAAMLENSLKLLNGRITVWWQASHIQEDTYPGGKSKNPVSAKISELYEADFRKQVHFKNSHFMCLLYTPPKGMDSFFEKVAYYTNKQDVPLIKALFMAARDVNSARKSFTFDFSQLQKYIGEFEGILETFIGSCTILKIRPLVLNDLLEYLFELVNPASGKQKVKLPHGMMLDGYLPNNYLTVGSEYLMFEGVQKKKYVAMVGIKDYPSKSETWMTDLLTHVKGDVLINQVYRILDHVDAKKIVQDAVNHHEMSAIPMWKRLLAQLTKQTAEANPHAYAMMEEAEYALSTITNERRQYAWHSMVAVCYGDTKEECEDTVKEVSNVLNQMGFISVRERINLLPAFLSAIPGHWDIQPKRQLVSIINHADLAPVNTMKSGDEVNEWLSGQSGKRDEAMCAFNTRYSVPYLFNFHHGSLGHTLIIGPAGSGKTVFESLLVAMYQKYDPISITFDKDYSCQIPIEMQGGGYIDISTKQVKFNPLLMLEDRKHWAWLQSFIETLLTARGEPYRTEHEKDVQEAIHTIAELGRENWRLSRLASQLSTELFERLEMWIGNGRYGYLFDNDEDTFHIGDMTGLEMGDLIKYHPIAAGAFMDYAFYQLDKKLDGKRPGIIDIQEAWFMMNNPRFAERLDDWLRTMRKRNVVVMMSTQSMQEINDSDYAMSFIDNIPNRIFLPNASAETHIKVYKSLFQLSDHQINEIKMAVPNRNYYLVNPDVSRMLEVRIKPDLLAFLRADGKALNLFRRIKAQGGKWREEYWKEIQRGI